MLSKWPIRNKLLLGAALLLVMVATLSASAYYGLYAYRSLVKGLSLRSTELPLASELSSRASNLRVTLSQSHGMREFLGSGVLTDNDSSQGGLVLLGFQSELDAFRDTLDRYRQTLNRNIRQSDLYIQDDGSERETLTRIDDTLRGIDFLKRGETWLLDEQRALSDLIQHVEVLHQLVAELPSHLYDRFLKTQHDVQDKYRTAIVITWVTSIGAAVAFSVFVRLFYRWVFRPLRILIQGSRRVAQGQFDHRIHLDGEDEMSELASAMNNMTARFQAIRDDLDRQVQERTKQVVRSEQLASVGFLAAGVAHEINNPLASIALCGESLESRLSELLDPETEDHQVIHDYLRMIQEEAFRCKQITEKLLDFSRMGDAERQTTDLRELVGGVIDMVHHLGKYRGKQIHFKEGQSVWAWANPQEMKQVSVNLITNALDSLDRGGSVTVDIRAVDNQAQITVVDDGCGMTEEVLKHLFEPFFTRRRGGQGTGLGLSITYRIIADHDGHIEATSDGPGEGSRFVITLPLADRHKIEKEKEHRYQAA